MSYTPSYEVKAAHDTGFSSRSFDQLFEQPINANNDYIIRIISLPILLLVMGFLSLFVLSGILISQCCCECARCIPETAKEARTSRIILTTMLSLSVIGAFVAAQIFMWEANPVLNQGIQNLSTTLQRISTTLTAISTTATDVQSSSNALDQALRLNSFANSSCQSAVRGLTDYKKVHEYTTAISHISNKVINLALPLAQTARTASNQLILASKDKDIAVAVLYSLAWLLCFLFAIGAALKNKVTMEVAMVPSALVVAILTLVCCGLLAMVMILGDYCMTPAQNTLLFLPSDTRSQAVGEYYRTCNSSIDTISVTLAAVGVPSLTSLDISPSTWSAYVDNGPSPYILVDSHPSPFSWSNNHNNVVMDTGAVPSSSSLSAAAAAVVASDVNLDAMLTTAVTLPPLPPGLGNSLPFSLSPCQPSDLVTARNDELALVAAVNDAATAVKQVSNTSSLVSCSAVQSLFTQTITSSKGLCGATATGLYSLTVALILFSGCLFLTMCIATVLMNTFGEDRYSMRSRARYHMDSMASSGGEWLTTRERDHEMVGLSPPSTPLPHKNPHHLDNGGEMKGNEEGGGMYHEGGIYSKEEGGAGPLRLPLEGCNCPLCKGVNPSGRRGKGLG